MPNVKTVAVTVVVTILVTAGLRIAAKKFAPSVAVYL